MNVNKKQIIIELKYHDTYVEEEKGIYGGNIE